MKIGELHTVLPVSWNESSALWYEICVEGVQAADREADPCRPNAAVLLGRILFRMEERIEFVLSEMESEGDPGTVPVTAGMLVGIAENDEPELLALIQELQKQLREEYSGSDELLTVTVRKEEPQALPSLHPVDLQKTIFYLVQIPEGVRKMSSVCPGQADTFCCLYRVCLLPDGLHCSFRVGCAVESAGVMLADQLVYLTEFLGGERIIRE